MKKKKPKIKQPDAFISVRVDPELKARLDKIAEADGRSLSNWVKKLISEKLGEGAKK